MGSTWCNQFLSSWNIFQKTVLFYFVHVSKSKVKEKEEIVDSWSIWKQTREQQKPIYFLIERRGGGGVWSRWTATAFYRIYKGFVKLFKGFSCQRYQRIFHMTKMNQRNFPPITQFCSKCIEISNKSLQSFSLTRNTCEVKSDK